jgi:uncharacterized protein YndB with AHSA1/START domain
LGAGAKLIYVNGFQRRRVFHTKINEFLMEAKMPYAFSLTTRIPASAQEIYDAWLDSLAHSEMTRGEASMSDEVGAAVSAWDGYISGRNLDLVPAERIVQSWRTTEFTDEHEDSIITLTLEDVEGGTLLTLVHSDVPDGQTSYEKGGWEEHYFEPMKEYFANRKRGRVGGKSKTAAPGTKRAAMGTKSKRVTPKTKSVTNKETSKRAATAKAVPKRVMKTKRREAQVKRSK